MKLWIAEKFDQGRAIATFLNGGPVTESNGAFLCNDGADAVAYCDGHLYELAEPEEYDQRYKRWKLEDLPIIITPSQTQFTVKDRKKRNVVTIQRLLKSATEVVHAGDFDNEGQLIVDKALREAGYDPAHAKRLILRGLDPGSIRDGIADLKPNADYLPLGEAAFARAIIDWAVGINLSRAYTIMARGVGYQRLMTVGRVKTPTLRLVVDRDNAIREFISITHYRVAALFHHPAKGDVVLEWDPPDGLPGTNEQKLVIDRSLAQRVADAVRNTTGIVNSAYNTTSTVAPPLPHNLTSLTREANAKYGLTAVDVLKIAQRLYEVLALISYPRTEWRHLPENQLPAAPGVLKHIAANAPQLTPFVAGADPSLRSAAWNAKEIGSHHGIIPLANSVPPNTLTKEEAQVYDLIARPFIAQFYPPALYSTTTISVHIKGTVFKTSSREQTDPGWADVMQRKASAPRVLPPLSVGDAVQCERAEVAEAQTKPPTRFTDGTLLEAMTSIADVMDDEELKTTLSVANGIGTPATRANIIEELVSYGMLARGDRKYLIATPAGHELIGIVEEDLSSPVYSARNEQELTKIAAGVGSFDAFVRSQFDTIAHRIQYAVTHPPKGVLGHHRPTRYRAQLLGKPDPSLAAQSRPRPRRRSKPELLKPTNPNA